MTAIVHTGFGPGDFVPFTDHLAEAAKAAKKPPLTDAEIDIFDTHMHREHGSFVAALEGAALIPLGLLFGFGGLATGDTAVTVVGALATVGGVTLAGLAIYWKTSAAALKDMLPPATYDRLLQAMPGGP